MRFIRSALGLAVVAAMVALPAEPASAAVTTFAITSSASYEGEPVPTGSLLTIFPDGVVTGESYSPGLDGYWPDASPAGLYVEASCGSKYDMQRLRIVYAGATQINVYWPNAAGSERYGYTCSYTGDSLITVHPALGYGSAVTKSVLTVQSHPGLFIVSDAPDGYWRDGYLYPGVAYARSAFSYCNGVLPSGDAYACSVSRYGSMATVELYLTGAEAFVYSAGLQVQLASYTSGILGPWVTQDLLSFTSYGVNPGTEQAIVRLKTGTAPGEYRIRVLAPSGSQSGQSLHVEFGLAA